MKVRIFRWRLVYLPGGQTYFFRIGLAKCGGRRVFSSRVDDRDRPAKNLVQEPPSLCVGDSPQEGSCLTFVCPRVYSCGPMTYLSCAPCTNWFQLTSCEYTVSFMLQFVPFILCYDRTQSGYAGAIISERTTSK